MKVAIVHDWLVTYRGGERVLEAIAELFPEAPIYTIFYNPKDLPESLKHKKIVVPKYLSFCFAFRRYLLPFLPSVVESFDLSDYDLVISTSSCVAKGVICDPESKHVSYIHSPMRYIWDQRKSYEPKGKLASFMAPVISFLFTYLRMWDFASSQRLNLLVANSSFVAKRIKSYYAMESVVLAPPVNTEFFSLPEYEPSNNYYLCFGALVSYKRIELAVEIADKLPYKLIIAGKGDQLEALKRLAGRQNIEFIEDPSLDQARELYQNARALLYPGVEDFGIVPIESMRCGTPVIAYAKGGAVDYIEHGKNGVLFSSQSGSGLLEGVKIFEEFSFDSKYLHQYAVKFSKQTFKEKFLSILEKYHGINL